jgi:hypothetical protein
LKIRSSILMLMVAAAGLMARAQEPESKTSKLDAALEKYIESGMAVSGIRYPIYNEEGELQAQFFIGQAVMQGIGGAQIKDLKIEIYQDGVVAATIYAPSCVTDVNVQSGGSGSRNVTVKSDGAVLVESEQVSLCGRGFIWRFEDGKIRFEVLNDTKVLVKQAGASLQEVRP